jgi:hypothetical protein
MSEPEDPLEDSFEAAWSDDYFGDDNLDYNAFYQYI